MSSSKRGRDLRELSVVVIGFAVLTAFMTAPLSTHIGSVARLDNADTRLLIWNVAWVARALVIDPLHVYDANIFYPRHGTLAYTEANLGAGILAIPVYWTTGNPYAAHNFALLASFVLSAASMYYLVRYLVGDRRAAAIAAIGFAYCPYVFGRIPHIHLLMTAGLPLSMLAFHRLADRPTVARGAVLGLAVAAQALFCGYYGIFVGLTVGLAGIVSAAVRRRWTDARYWTSVATAAGVALALALPLFLPYMRLQRATNFRRPLDDARSLSADWRAYLASSAYAHAWMLPIIRHWADVLFPGFVTAVFGAAGIPVAWRARGRLREVAVLYSVLGAMAVWASAGPDAGLYSWLYTGVPAFNLLRAPVRFGLIVTFALSVLAGVSSSTLLARIARSAVPAGLNPSRSAPVVSRRAVAAAVLLGVLVVAELKVPLTFSPVPPVAPAYRVLAGLPRGAVIEIPFYSWQSKSERTRYMLSSTAHWMPLVNGYSSYTPRDFIDETGALAGFPSDEAFRLLKRDRVRYAVVHMDLLAPDQRADVATRLHAYGQYIQRRYGDDRVSIFEIVAFPG